VNVPLEPARVPQAPHPERVLRTFLACPACRGKNQPEGWPLHRRGGKMEEAEHDRSGARCIVPLRVSRFASTGTKGVFSKAFLLTSLRTLAPANSFLSHTSLKHPGVACTPSDPRLLYQLRTPHLASCAPTPYGWAIALRFSWCHNRFSGWLLVRRVAMWRGGPPGAETFCRLVVSNILSGRGLGLLLPIRSAKRPDAGKWYLGRPLWPRPAWASSPSRACSLKTG
jgi:hypothetical protein